MQDSLIAFSQMFAHDLGKLPAQKFFEPLSCFGAWMVTQFEGIPVWDVGAGMGHVSKELHERGFQVCAIDILQRDKNVYPVFAINGDSCGYTKGSVVMLCRPCHGYFPDSVIKQALKCKVGAIVYVGLPKNKRIDLGKYAKYFKSEMRKCGFDGESAYVWRMEYLKTGA